MDSIKIDLLLKDRQFDLRLELLAGEGGLDRKLVSSRIQKPGLALAGFTEHIHKDRMQVFGNTEMSYLATLKSEEGRERMRKLFHLPIACLVVTKNLHVDEMMKREAADARVPLLRTSHLSSVFIDNVERFLQEALTITSSVHGVLIDVIGVGVLILGKSGIGKSELALDLVTRGHRLVADDIVDLKKRQGGSVYGSGSEIIKHHMEIRGLGIINIKDLFGISAVRDAKKIELVVELVEWNEEEEYDRLGVEELRHSILDVAVPMLRVPIRPGRNITSIIEVAARNQLLKYQGKHSAREFQDRLNRALIEAKPDAPRVRVDEVE
jgi:HPr kinase/phosphorylase